MIRADEREAMLAPLAGASERANRPTAMVVFCAVLLLASAAFASLSARDASAARRAFQTQQDQYAQVQTIAAQMRAIREQQDAAAQGDDAYAPEPRLLSQLQQTASQAGLATLGFSVEESREEAPGRPIIRRVVTYRLNGQEIPPVMAWIQEALRSVKGLFITHFSMKPTARGWDIQIKFARWELKS